MSLDASWIVDSDPTLSGKKKSTTTSDQSWFKELLALLVAGHTALFWLRFRAGGPSVSAPLCGSFWPLSVHRLSTFTLSLPRPSWSCKETARTIRINFCRTAALPRPPLWIVLAAQNGDDGVPGCHLHGPLQCLPGLFQHQVGVPSGIYIFGGGLPYFQWRPDLFGGPPLLKGG